MWIWETNKIEEEVIAFTTLNRQKQKAKYVKWGSGRKLLEQVSIFYKDISFCSIQAYNSLKVLLN